MSPTRWLTTPQRSRPAGVEDVVHDRRVEGEPCGLDASSSALGPAAEMTSTGTLAKLALARLSGVHPFMSGSVRQDQAVEFMWVPGVETIPWHTICGACR